MSDLKLIWVRVKATTREARNVIIPLTEDFSILYFVGRLCQLLISDVLWCVLVYPQSFYRSRIVARLVAQFTSHNIHFSKYIRVNCVSFLK